MTTRGAPRGAAVLGFRLGLALLTGALAAGCGDSGRTGDAAVSRNGSASPSPSPHTTPPEELCTRIVAFWSRQVLDDATYGDYQSMGLSNAQYEILRTVVAAARAEKKRQGATAADELIDREAREGCVDRYRDGAPSKGAWR